MKKFLFLPFLIITFFFFGCSSTGTGSTVVTDIENALLTSENVLQQLNTGVQTVAPTLSTLLTMTHNQGDATAVNNVASESAALTPALTALLGSVQTAISSSTTPSAQVAAVNVALSPATASAIVAPIAAATSN